MTTITSHVLDTTAGRPAAGIAVRLDRSEGGTWVTVASNATDGDGRVGDWLPDGVHPGRYRLVFQTGAWFQKAGRESLYPEVVVCFEVADGVPHYHLPLLLAPFGYSTYQGS